VNDRADHSRRDNGSRRDGCGGRYRVVAAAAIVTTVVIIIHVDVHIAVYVPIHIRVVVDRDRVLERVRNKRLQKTSSSRQTSLTGRQTTQCS
jgi:type IV secretory pathway VirB3-like protein